MTVNEDSMFSLLLQHAVSEEGFPPHSLFRNCTDSGNLDLRSNFNCIQSYRARALRHKSHYLPTIDVDTRPINVFDTLFPSLFTLGDIHYLEYLSMAGNTLLIVQPLPYPSSDQYRYTQ